jgi:RIP metalloprotease RseP
VGSVAIKTPDEFVARVKALAVTGSPIPVSVSRSGSTLEFSIVPENGKIGAYVSYAGVEFDRNFQYRYGFLDAVNAAAEETVSQTVFTFELLGRLFQKLVFPVGQEDRKEAAEAVGGPIAIGGLFVDLVDAKVPASVIFAVAALLSINLGAFNLLPLPALDGGRFFLMTLVEPFRRWGKIALIRKIENSVHSAGFILFIFLAITIAFHDVSKFFR